MKSLNRINPIRDYLKHSALAVAMAAGLAAPVSAEPPPPPGGVTDLVLWLDASAADTMTMDGTTVNEARRRSLVAGAGGMV